MSGPPPVPPLSQGQYASKTVGTQQKDMKGKGSPENPGGQKINQGVTKQKQASIRLIE